MVARFLLASLTIEAVLQGVTIHQRRQTLLERTKGSGLDDAYSATLDWIRGQGGSKSKLGMAVLMWLSYSKSPLNAEDLCYAMGIEVGTTNMNLHNVPSKGVLMSCTLGLVTIDKHASTVRLVHFTLHEYLASHPGLFTAPHSMIAEVCLTYLNFQSICEPSTSLGTVPLTTPLLRYASLSWGSHVVLCTSRAGSSPLSPGVPRARAGSSRLESLGTQLLAARTGVDEPTRAP